ncbi:MAG: riboflavin biosynthesis protein RibD [Spirochaetae bacterium HGW-Spirochaetae-5]|nr:MAG: riboflavin biosynthesis protein RibD [Spirochaetae bacterium HGW-Spirochaetae-5]
MTVNDLYMKRACVIAFTRIGCTSPNPAVGAVIVKNGSIIGEGGTGAYGCDHAEVTAIKDAMQRGHDLSGAEIYVSLEPCSHFGKTPPCTDAIINCGISKVHVPLMDPNPVVSGSGIRKLIEAGVEVNIMHNYFQPASDLIRSFKKYILRGQPFVINKCAVTLDGKIAASSGDSRWISNEYSRLFVHKLRSKVDAVIVGSNTLVKDNPMLNIRMNDFGDDIKNSLSDCCGCMTGRDNFYLAELMKSEIKDYKDPLRVLVGIPAEITIDCNFFRDDNYLIIAGEKEYERALKTNKELKAISERLKIVTGSFDSHEDSVRFTLNALKEKGVMSALLEGGGALNGSFFNAGAIDQFMYVIAPKVLGSGIAPINGAPSERMSDSLLLRDVSTVLLGDNLLFSGYKEEYNFEMM